MPFYKLRAAGVPICLGSDEMNTDDTVNLWFVAKTAALLQTLGTRDYRDWPQPAEMLRGADARRRARVAARARPRAVSPSAAPPTSRFSTSTRSRSRR